jgi:hypothetical protein
MATKSSPSHPGDGAPQSPQPQGQQAGAAPPPAGQPIFRDWASI